MFNVMEQNRLILGAPIVEHNLFHAYTVIPSPWALVFKCLRRMIAYSVCRTIKVNIDCVSDFGHDGGWNCIMANLYMYEGGGGD